MPRRPIIYFGDERLITSSKPIKTFDNELQALIEEMFETMYATNGVGLAAPQLGINIQLAVIDVTEDRSEQWCLINPEITWTSGEIPMMEGCLSIPGVYEEILRPENIAVKARDQNNEPLNIEASGLLARCIQHEMDHLEGKLFIDYLSPLKRQRAIEIYRKTLRQLKKESNSG